MYLECVTVCVNYGDFLAETLPLNRHLFNYMVVVTSPEDVETQKLCEHWDVHCIVADIFSEGFNKSKAINIGLNALTKKGWVVHLDADIVLPPLTRKLIERADLDQSMVYGIDRHEMKTASKWRKHLQRPKLQHEANAYVHTNAYPIATRFAPLHTDGYVPIGFFQMWNPVQSGIWTYPDNTKVGAGQSDTLFAAQWPRSKRAFIPEIIGYHLESEPGAQGVNWDGRQTCRFDEKPPWYKCCCWWWLKRRHHKHHHHHHPPYDCPPDPDPVPWYITNPPPPLT